MACNVEVIAFHFTISKAFYRSMVMQYLLGVLILPNPWTISLVKSVLSEMLLPAMNIFWWGDISHVETFDIQSDKILVKSL